MLINADNCQSQKTKNHPEITICDCRVELSYVSCASLTSLTVSSGLAVRLRNCQFGSGGQDLETVSPGLAVIRNSVRGLSAGCKFAASGCLCLKRDHFLWFICTLSLSFFWFLAFITQIQ